MLIYVISAYAGNIEVNTEMARRYCRREYEQGNVPIAPHLLFPQFMDEATERYEGILMGLEVLERCDAVHVYGDDITEGMRMEIISAEECNIPIEYMGA